MTRDELSEQRAGLKAYLQQKVKAEDWHGAADACMDLREIDAALQAMASVAPVEPRVASDYKTSTYNARMDRYEFSDGTPDVLKNTQPHMAMK